MKALDVFYNRWNEYYWAQGILNLYALEFVFLSNLSNEAFEVRLRYIEERVDTALEIDPKSIDNLFVKGMLLIWKGDFKGEEFDRVVATLKDFYPNDSWSFYLQAFKCYQEAKEMDPRRYQTEKIAEQNALYLKAETFAREAVRRYPYDSGERAFSERQLLIEILIAERKAEEVIEQTEMMEKVAGGFIPERE